jgi:hypothetical protein
MLANGERSIVFPAAKKGTMLKTAPRGNEKEERELKPTSSTLTPKKIHCTKEAKPKEVEWHWSKQKWR